jgi:hypothetical protein
MGFLLVQDQRERKETIDRRRTKEAARSRTFITRKRRAETGRTVVKSKERKEA